MRDNLSKVVDRGERLDDLEQRAGQSMSVEPASGLLALYVRMYSTYVNVCMLQCECVFGYTYVVFCSLEQFDVILFAALVYPCDVCLTSTYLCM